MHITIFGLLYGLFLAWAGFTVLRKQRRRDFLSVFFGIMFLCGCSGVVSFFLDSRFGFYTCVIFFAGILAIWAPIDEHLLVKQCRTPIEAKCVRYNWRPTGGMVDMYIPVFEYWYCGVKYTLPTSLCFFSKKKAEKNFPVGNLFQIWIDAENPGRCTAKRKVPIGRYLFFLPIGVGCLAFYAYVITHEVII